MSLSSYCRRLAWAGSAALVVLGCTPADGLDSGDMSFVGLSGITRTLTGTYTLSWEAATAGSATITYDVYIKDVGELKPTDGDAIGPITGGKALDSGRVAALTGAAAFASLNLAMPATEGSFLETLSAGELSLDLKQRLRSDRAYALQVVARDDRGQAAASPNVAVISAIGQQTYRGCLSAESAGAGRVRIEVEYLPGFEKIAVLRDGELVHEADTPEARVIFDSGLEVGKSYVYECQGIAASEVLVGSQKLTVQAVSPFSDYQGCLKVEAMSGGTARLDFEFPDGATKVSIYRDGELKFETTSAVQTWFTDTGLKSGQTYSYRCEAENFAAAQSGKEDLKLTMPDVLKDFAGCASAREISATEVEVTVDLVSGVDAINVLRDGITIGSVTRASETVFYDSGLIEGQSYRYNCAAVVGSDIRLGKSEILVTTQSIGAPEFDGIDQHSVQTPRSVKIVWKAAKSTGVVPAYYQVYMNPGTTPLWDTASAKSISPTQLETTLTDLGDQMTYVFGVRACTARDICDTNQATRTVTMTSDALPPLTIGATAATVVSGKAVISAPWLHGDGALAKRYLYRKKPTAAATSLAFDDYVFITSTDVDGNDRHAPPTTLVDQTISGNTNYTYAVVDEDPTAKKNLTLISTGPDRYAFNRSASLFTGDIDPPSFFGIVSLLSGDASAKDTTLKATFVAAQHEDTPGAAGASHYIVYTLAGGGNACVAGTAQAPIDASQYPAGQQATVTITGLLPRTLYSVCVKARDLAGNLSLPSANQSRSTQDLTPPLFDGVQSVTYNKSSGAIDVRWNPSPSSDILNYKVTLWKNTPAPDPNTLAPPLESLHAQSPGGLSFASTTFAFEGSDTLYVRVVACDNAHQAVQDGIQNCSAAGLPFVYLVPDITPPADFEGIESAPNLGRPAQGQVLVRWKTPPSWTDYRGFTIYKVDLTRTVVDSSALTFLKACPCSANHCPNHLNECLLEGLEARRSYNLHVRAYDANDNQTTYVSPIIKTTTIKTLDTTPPSFVSGLTAVIDEGAVALDFGVATDNQSPHELGAKVMYEIYRSEGATFADPTAPSSGLRIDTVETDSYADINIASHVTYYYTVCAIDTIDEDKPEPNRTCDGVVRSILTPDIDPPTIDALTSAKVTDSKLKTWDLTWTLDDNSGVGNVVVAVKQNLSESSVPPSEESDYTALISQSGLTSLTSLKGPRDLNRYIHYLVRAQDQAGNKTTKVLSLYSENQITVSAVQRDVGTTAGGKIIVLEGAGFVTGSPGSTVKIGNLDCLDTVVYTSTILACKTPAQTAGAYALTITNPENSGSVQLPSGYTYVGPGDPAIELCDTSAATVTNGFAGGAGTPASPYVVCSPGQLNYIRNIVRSKSYVLGDNINLNDLAATGNNLTPIKSSDLADYFEGDFDGQGRYILNFRYQEPTETSVGVFKGLNRANVQHLRIVGADVHGGLLVGILTGDQTGGCAYALTDIWVHGKVRGERRLIGGMIGAARSMIAQARAWVDVALVDTDNTLPDNWGSAAAAGLVAYFGGGCTMEDVVVEGKVHQTVQTPSGSNFMVGGIIGQHDIYSVVRNAHAKVDVLNTGLSWGTGGVVGFSSGATVRSCTFSGNLVAPGRSGGIAGWQYNSSAASVLEDNVVTGTVTGGSRSGGIVGHLPQYEQYVRRNVFAGKLSADAVDYVGGIVGSTEEGLPGPVYIEDNISSGTITSTGSDTGGIVGRAYCHGQATCSATESIKRNLFNGTVNGRAQTGGIVGRAVDDDDSLTISQNVSQGVVTGTISVGGIVGHSGGRIVDNRSASTVTGTANVGGIVGYLRTYGFVSGPPQATSIGYNIASGKVIPASGATSGGLIGLVSFGIDGGATPVPVSYLGPSYFNVGSSGISYTDGDPTKTFAVSEAAFKLQTTLTTYGFDIATPVWIGVNGAYPKLHWED